MSASAFAFPLFPLLLCFSTVVGACQHRARDAFAYQQGTEADGFTLLWEANKERCVALQEAAQISFKDCRRFEMQTPLYNQKDRPRQLTLELRFSCESSGELELAVALAKRPANVVVEAEKGTITNAWQQERVKPAAGITRLKLEIPPRENAMFVALLDPFKGQSVRSGCRISYRFAAM